MHFNDRKFLTYWTGYNHNIFISYQAMIYSENTYIFYAAFNFTKWLKLVEDNLIPALSLEMNRFPYFIHVLFNFEYCNKLQTFFLTGSNVTKTYCLQQITNYLLLNKEHTFLKQITKALEETKYFQIIEYVW